MLAAFASDGTSIVSDERADGGLIFMVSAKAAPLADPESDPGSLALHCMPRYATEWLVLILEPPDSVTIHDPTIQVEFRFGNAPPSTRVLERWASDSASFAALHHGAVGFMQDMLPRDRLTATLSDDFVLRFDLSTARPDLLEFNRLCAEWRDGTPANSLAAALTDARDAFTDERQLKVRLISDTEAAALFFHCELEEHCYGRRPRARLAVYPTSELNRIVSRDAERAELDGMERVRVQLRVDQEPALHSDWWWIAPDTHLLGVAVSPPFGRYCDEDENLLREAANGQRLIAKVRGSTTFQFDVGAARDNLMEFTRRCAAWRSVDAADADESPSQAGDQGPKAGMY